MIREDWRVGEVRVVRLAELEVRVPSSAFFGEQRVAPGAGCSPTGRQTTGDSAGRCTLS